MNDTLITIHGKDYNDTSGTDAWDDGWIYTTVTFTNYSTTDPSKDYYYRTVNGEISVRDKITEIKP